MDEPVKPDQPIKPQLGLWDAVSIIIGIIIGATIYESPWLIYNNVSSFGMALGAWLLGGVFSFIGALCYAELATAYPRSGGDYVYLTRAYGSWMGFLFAWAQLTVAHTGAIGMVAYVFADYTHRLFWGKSEDGTNISFVFAALAVAILTVVNILGLITGKRTQNVLTAAKMLGLTGIIVAGLFFAQPVREYFQGKVTAVGDQRVTVQGRVVMVGDEQLIVADDSEQTRIYTPIADVPVLALDQGSKLAPLAKDKKQHAVSDLPLGVSVRVTASTTEPEKALRIEESPQAGSPSFGFAMVLVFLAFSGYNDAAYVAAEVRNRRRNMVLALLLGVAAVTIIYLLVNLAYLLGLGFEEARRSREIAADVFRLWLGDAGEKVMCLVVMISALGGINGSILTGSRVFASLGADHRIFRWMGGWNTRLGSPIGSLVTLGLICLVMILGVGTPWGQAWIKDLIKAAMDNELHLPSWAQTPIQALIEVFGLSKFSWEGHGGFETLLKFTTPVFWLFFLLNGLALFVLRERDPDIERPFRVPLYPFLPLLFVGTCVYMLHSGINYAGGFGLIGAGLLLVGLLLYTLSGKPRSQEGPKDAS